MSRPRSTLALRIAAVCAGSAVVAVAAAGLLSARLVATSSRETAAVSLGQQADVVAGQLEANGLGARVGTARVVDVLEGQGISVVVVAGDQVTATDATAGSAARDAVGPEVVGTLRAGEDVSRTVRVDRRTVLVEGRVTGPRQAVVLVQPWDSSTAVARTLARRIALSLVAGAAVAVLAGVLLASVVSRPLRQTAAGVTLLRGGRRDVRVAVAGPREVADVAAGVNALADALQQSESRQRRFLLSVSHELRTPLTTVTGYAESLADGVVTGDEVRRVGATVLDEARRLDRLVQDLLDLARIGADDFRLDLTDVDLVELCTGAAAVWRDRGAAQGVLVRLDLDPSLTGPLVVTTDARRVRQVVDGLAGNALRPLGSGQVVVLGLVPTTGGGARIEVRDSGSGLTEDDYGVAFEPHALSVRYADRPGGEGIGLSLVHRLTERLGGRTHAGPAPEGGACFTVSLPSRAPQQPSPAAS